MADTHPPKEGPQVDIITSGRPTPPPYEGFAAIVADALHQAHVPDGCRADAVETIDGAHQVRVRMLTHQAEEEKRATLAYAAMDRANQSIMGFVKRTLGSAIEVNAQQHAMIESLTKMRDQVRELADTLPTDDPMLPHLVALLHTDFHELPPLAPVIIGMAVDQRFSYGEFHHAGTGREQTLSFVGWSLVVHRPRLRTGLEPTFVGPGSDPTTRLTLALDGWELKGLH